ncbi:unnamed protein product [Chondrus crispus]|uniref:Uncharacterized protein n=1 Tax=Chondrus crispus TaxID=2769 RepID=R7QTQ1_CHOCR|nr:unnamed protein product [Chondrus crispus]CDF40755.1 unnamed protein product [Chondrus crispus]|eukprot:XP_005711049.1 unnamed protein product [Chondrus crispus]
MLYASVGSLFKQTRKDNRMPISSCQQPSKHVDVRFAIVSTYHGAPPPFNLI